MAKYKYTQVGSIIKGKDGKPDYLKIRDTITLHKGDILNLESVANKEKSLQQAVADGKMSPETMEKIMEGVRKTPTWVRFSVTKAEKLD